MRHHDFSEDVLEGSLGGSTDQELSQSLDSTFPMGPVHFPKRITERCPKRILGFQNFAKAPNARTDASGSITDIEILVSDELGTADSVQRLRPAFTAVELTDEHEKLVLIHSPDASLP